MPRTKPEIVVRVTEKRCSKCKITKPRSEFYRCSLQPSGLMCACNECRKADSSARYEKNKESILSKARSKFKDNPKKYKATRAAWRLSESGVAYETSKKRKQQKKIAHAGWRAKNIDTLRVKRRVWQKMFRLANKDNPLFTIRRNLKERMRKAFSGRSWRKNGTTIQIIGCTAKELKIFIEKKFQPGMSWENYSREGWHLDHIIPISSATTVEQLIALCHYTNLQPLWAHENLAKSNKLPEVLRLAAI